MVRWWWPGGDVSNGELRHEVDLLDQAGFGGAEIQPFNIGLKRNLPPQQLEKVNDYLTPTFFSHVTAALEEARARGMWLDYTFGSGWPFGGAGVVTPDLAAMQLLEAHQTIRGPVEFHGKLSMPQLSPAVRAEFAKLPGDWAEQFRKRERLVAVIAVRGSSVQFYPNQSANQPPIVKATGDLKQGTAVVLTTDVQPDGTLNWSVPPGVWQVFVFKEMPTGQETSGGVGPQPSFVLNHMSREAFETYANRVGGTLKQHDSSFFGNTLRAVFIDSLEVHAYLYWNDDFLHEFEKLRGYDLTPYLPLLKIPGRGVPYTATAADLPLYNTPGIGNRVRRDYWQTVSDIMDQDLYQPLNEWAHENHLLSRVQSHGSPTDVLRVYGQADIPETEDLYDNGRYDFLKMSSSAGDLYGRNIVSSESFVWHGAIYQTTPEKIKRFADELITAGINEIIYHGFPYQRMDRQFPGWDPFQLEGAFSSDVNPTNPFFSYLPKLNAYITRLQYISQTGESVVPVALYRGGLAYPDIEPPLPEPAIDTELMDAGYNFDHIDASILLACHVRDKELVSPGGEKYKVLVLPNQKAISDPVAKQLTSFASAGLPIVFVSTVPGVVRPVVDGQVPAGLDHSMLPPILTDGNVGKAASPADAVKALEALEVHPNLQFDGQPLPFIEKRIGSLSAFFLRNPSDASVTFNGTFDVAGSPEIWNAWTGTVHPATGVTRQGSTTHLTLHLTPYGSALLVFDPSVTSEPESPQAESPASATKPISIGQSGWKFHGVGIGPGSKPETIDLTLQSLEDWRVIPRLRNFSGRGVYSATVTVPAEWLGSHRHILLDLGDVKDAATVSINGKPGPELLMRPYRADITPLVHAGENTLQITVVNTLYNALSAQGPSDVYTPQTTHTPDGLMPSGLIGPVVLRERP